jgi:DNA-binding transcriptional LysR family regulator
VDTRITLQKLEIFELVVELGSVSQAADRLWVAQPVVTAHIRSLEERLGATLFSRAARRMELTEAGEAVHVWAADVLRRTSEVSRDLDGLAGGQRGAITVAASLSLGSYALPPLLTRFQRDRPLVHVKLNVSDYRLAIRDVESSGSDFAVVAAPTNPANRRVESELLGEDEMVAIAPATGVVDADAASMTPEAFSRLPFIEIARHAAMQRELHRGGIRPQNVMIDLGHPEAVKRAVMDGLGVAIVFRSAVSQELASGQLREIELEGVRLALNVYLVSRVHKQFAPVHEELIDAIRRHLGTTVTGESPA